MMRRKLYRNRRNSLALLVSLLLPLLIGCTEEKSLHSLNVDSLSWTEYTNREVRYSLRYPTVFTVDDDAADNVFLRYSGAPPVVVRFIDEEEGRRRGTWFGHNPVEDIQLASRSGKKYVCDHWDGPFRARTIAYVIPYRDKYLGLEFRTDRELYPVQERILSSFTLPAQ